MKKWLKLLTLVTATTLLTTGCGGDNEVGYPGEYPVVPSPTPPGPENPEKPENPENPENPEKPEKPNPPKDAPVIALAEGDISQPQEVKKWESKRVIVSAPFAIRSLTLKSDSQKIEEWLTTSLTSTPLDLANLTKEETVSLEALGLLDKETTIKNATSASFDLKGLARLAYGSLQPGDRIHFTITVTDEREVSSEQTVTLIFPSV